MALNASFELLALQTDGGPHSEKLDLILLQTCSRFFVLVHTYIYFTVISLAGTPGTFFYFIINCQIFYNNFIRLNIIVSTELFYDNFMGQDNFFRKHVYLIFPQI